MIKQQLIELLDFYKYKLVNDKCTQDDMKSVYKMLSEQVTNDARIADIAEFYGQSESNVRNVVSRNRTDKPKRALLYNFHSITKIIPKRWRAKHADS